MYKILIVENEYLSTHVLEMMIKKEFKNTVEIISVNNGLDGKKVIDNEDINLSIINTNVPIINGIELSRYIKIKHVNTVIVMIAGDYDDKLIKKVFAVSPDEYFLKPVKLDLLLKSLKKYINNDLKEIKDKKEELISNIVEHFIEESNEDVKTSIRRFVDYVFDNSKVSDIRRDFMELYYKIEGICRKYDIDIINGEINKLNGIIESALLNRDKNKLLLQFEIVVDSIFEEIYKQNNNSKNTYIQSAMEYVEKNIKRNITLEEVARHISITPHYLSKIFKKEVGVNFITYVTDRKIDLAKKMLEDESIPIVNISIELSFNQANYFSKVFKKKVGLTPSEYREKSLENKSTRKIFSK